MAVHFLRDKDCDMLKVIINGKVWREGNYWDFDFQSDVPDMLDAMGTENYEQDYTYED